MEDAKFANTKEIGAGKKPKWITVNRLNTFYGGPFFIVPLTSVKPIYVIDLEMLRVWHILQRIVEIDQAQKFLVAGLPSEQNVKHVK